MSLEKSLRLFYSSYGVLLTKTIPIVLERGIHHTNSFQEETFSLDSDILRI